MTDAPVTAPRSSSSRFRLPAPMPIPEPTFATSMPPSAASARCTARYCATPRRGYACVAVWGLKRLGNEAGCLLLPGRAGEAFGKRQTTVRCGKTKPRWGGSLVGAGGQQRYAGHDGGYSREPRHVDPHGCGLHAGWLPVVKTRRLEPPEYATEMASYV